MSNTKQQTAKMLALVADKFKTTFDKAGEPYFYHCLAVMQGLPEDADEYERQIALGHDLLEDTDLTKMELFAMGFDEVVIDGICRLTKHRGQSYDEYKERVSGTKRTVRVKMSDLTHNSDIRRIKGVPDEKDYQRTSRYRKFYHELENTLKGVV